MFWRGFLRRGRYWTYARRWFRDSLNFQLNFSLREHFAGVAAQARPQFPALQREEEVFADGAAGTQVRAPEHHKILKACCTLLTRPMSIPVQHGFTVDFV